MDRRSLPAGRPSHPLVLWLLALSAAAAGCRTLGPGGDDDAHRYEKPLIAVTAFENRVAFPYDGSLGPGIAGLLENALYETGEFRVLDRADIGALIAEQDLQRTDLTREEEAVPPGRLRNAHYLVKGTVTEFAHVEEAGLDFGIGPLRIGGGGQHAVVSVALKTTEVETGEVIHSRVVEGKAYAGDVEFGAVYEHLALGGQRFERTPLGRALEEALEQAVEGIRAVVGQRPWHPVIAEVSSDRVVLTGGRDRRLEPGSRWLIRTLGEPIVDPRTGDLLGRREGEVVGVLRIARVKDRWSEAVIESGEGFARGQRLEPLQAGE